MTGKNFASTPMSWPPWPRECRTCSTTSTASTAGPGNYPGLRSGATSTVSAGHLAAVARTRDRPFAPATVRAHRHDDDLQLHQEAAHPAAERVQKTVRPYSTDRTPAQVKPPTQMEGTTWPKPTPPACTPVRPTSPTKPRGTATRAASRISSTKATPRTSTHCQPDQLVVPCTPATHGPPDRARSWPILSACWEGDEADNAKTDHRRDAEELHVPARRHAHTIAQSLSNQASGVDGGNGTVHDPDDRCGRRRRRRRRRARSTRRGPSGQRPTGERDQQVDTRHAGSSLTSGTPRARSTARRAALVGCRPALRRSRAGPFVRHRPSPGPT